MEDAALLAEIEVRAPALRAAMARLLASSRFAAGALAQMLADGAADAHGADAFADFDRRHAPGEMAARLRAVLSSLPPEAFMRVLRRQRNRALLRIALRDVNAWADLDETLTDLSALADACIAAALAQARAQLVERHGEPRDAAGERLQPVVLGMGKLGGGELNFSSDIDLIFCHTGYGQTDGARVLEAGEFFARLARDTSRLLAERTEDGFVYRVDLQLRPFGSAGALSASFAAMEEYYQVHGREWERYALIKARPVAGDLKAGHRLLNTLRPFVYRRYLDYGAIGNLRALKQLIEDEVARKGLEDDIKLGAGGIREVEFIVQSFQLVRGGAIAALRDPRLRPVLRFLGEQGYLERTQAQQLDAAYVFLRRLENAIQFYADQQTHALPQDAAARAALLQALGHADWAALLQALLPVRQFVRAQFTGVFAATPGPTDDTRGCRQWVAAFWNGTLEGEAAQQALFRLGFAQASQALLAQLESLRQQRLVRAMRDESSARLQMLLAQLLDETLAQQASAAAAEAGPETTPASPTTGLIRALQVIEAVAGRASYLVLLQESAAARVQLLRLCGASGWLASYIARAPLLLDSLLDARSLYAPPLREEMASELAQRMQGLEWPADTERAMNLLRHYQQEVTLRVAAADLAGILPLVQVSDRLTWLAEVIVERCLQLAHNEMRGQYGEALRRDGTPVGFAVIGYGKFGGIEMGYGSDLDLVFLHDCDAPQGMTAGGKRSLDASTYLARLAQRLIHWLSTQTTAGRAYEVDMELRPNGRSGMLVTRLEGFADYQRADAWTWEHQALTRARFVAGDRGVGEGFERVRREVLTQPRDADRLRVDIVAMRDRMRAALDKSTDAWWDIKHGRGGLVDIEFITQYLVLRHAPAHPDVVRWSDNWRQLEALHALGVISHQDLHALIEHYRMLREFVHAKALQGAKPIVAQDRFHLTRSRIEALWLQLMVPDSVRASGQTDDR